MQQIETSKVATWDETISREKQAKFTDARRIPESHRLLISTHAHLSPANPLKKSNAYFRAYRQAKTRAKFVSVYLVW